MSPDPTVPTRPADVIDGLADLLPQVVSDVITSTVSGVHTAVSGRVFGLVPGSGLVRAVHDAIATGIHATIGRAVGGAGRGLQGAARTTAHLRDPLLLEGNPRWRMFAAVLNGVLGDLLEEQGNPLAIRTSVRFLGRDVAPTREGFAAAFPEATSRIGVLVHGLVESDDSWGLAVDGRDGRTYDDDLADAGLTPVRVRYNSGRHISESAEDLSALLEQLVSAWPVPVEELVLIGHSMGGLVIRGAAEVAISAAVRWPDRCTNVVMLGTPHTGAPLEVVANAGAWLLAALPEMAPFGLILRRRSAGIKDLRHGYVRRQDWDGHDPDARRSARASAALPLPVAANHLVGATLTVDAAHPVGHVLGDLLVRLDSASAGGHEWAQAATVTHLGGVNHFDLLNHQRVADLLRDLLTAS